MELLLSSVSEASLWAVMAIGIFLMYKILDIPDLTAEGAFPLGAAICASQITMGASPFLGTIYALIGGAIAGLVSGLIHTKLKIPALLTGILTMTGLYTINLRIMGSGNVTLLGKDTLMSMTKTFVPDKYVTLIIGAIVLTIVIFILYLFYQTQIGLALIATGDNEIMSQANSINIDAMKIIGYMIANGLIALSGALMAQNNGYADISMGIGTIVIGLASVIIAGVLVKNVSFTKRLMVVVLGAIIYRFIISLVLEMNVEPTDLKLVSAVILAIFLTMPNVKAPWKKKIKSREVS